MTTQLFSERSVSEIRLSSVVGLVINTEVVEESCEMSNWAQDLLINVVMKTKKEFRWSDDAVYICGARENSATCSTNKKRGGQTTVPE